MPGCVLGVTPIARNSLSSFEPTRAPPFALMSARTGDRSAKPGFRFAERNSSRHYHASAMDIRIHGVSINEMYSYAESLDGGGMGLGLYPTSGFIHVDFRAPGEPSYRWTDTHGPDRHKKHKKKPRRRTQSARKPTS